MRVLLGVCGGIAAYKAAEIVRALQNERVSVEVAMTDAATRFITPLTFSALTGRPVYTSLWTASSEPAPDAPIEHIALAQSIDALLVAPATANSLARFAMGLADDFLSTVYLASTAPVVLAPAMNLNMWQHPATQANVRTLQDRGARIIEPDVGYLACGMTGGGRLASVDRIVAETLSSLARGSDLKGETVLVTAGGTREAIDPVRFLGNRSSGRTGHALAEAALARGARVILITASSLPVPAGCIAISALDTQSMAEALNQHIEEATMVFATAAVTDFRPAAYSASKLRRTRDGLTLHLEPTPDLIAAAAARRRPETVIVAFAAETENLEANARAKLLRKGVDAIFANDVSQPGIGFESDNNAGLFLTPEQTVSVPLATKRQIADRLLDHAVALRSSRPHSSELHR